MADTEDTETLVGIMRQATIDDDRPLPLSYPSDFAMFARAVLASSWLAARDERIRADEREKLAAVEALARRDCLVAALRTPRIGDRGACARSAEISRTAERGETGGRSALTCPMCGTEGIPLRPPVKRGQA